MNLELQKQQKRCSNICKYSQEKWRQISAGESVDLVNSSEFVEKSQKEETGPWDPASYMLFFFLFVLLLLSLVGIVSAQGAAS